MPQTLARINTAGTTPYVAVTLAGLLIALLTAIGGVKLAWSFSALTVLIYNAITSLAALQLLSHRASSAG